MDADARDPRTTLLAIFQGCDKYAAWTMLNDIRQWYGVTVDDETGAVAKLTINGGQGCRISNEVRLSSAFPHLRELHLSGMLEGEFIMAHLPPALQFLSLQHLTASCEVRLSALPASLRSLRIVFCPNFVTPRGSAHLDWNGMSHLSSLVGLTLARSGMSGSVALHLLPRSITQLFLEGFTSVQDWTGLPPSIQSLTAMVPGIINLNQLPRTLSYCAFSPLLRLECDLAAPGLEWLADCRTAFAWAGVIHLGRGGTLTAQTLFDVVRSMHRFNSQVKMTVLSADVVRELSAREQAQWTLETATFIATATLQCQERVARQGIARTCDWETMHFELVLGSGAAREGW